MAKKDVDLYYQQVLDQYLEMRDNIKELEEYSLTHMVEPERIDKMKQIIEPIKNNYNTLSYIMFLLNQPAKKKKIPKYKKQSKKLLDSIPHKNTKEGILEENKSCIIDMKNNKTGDLDG